MSNEPYPRNLVYVESRCPGRAGPLSTARCVFEAGHTGQCMPVRIGPVILPPAGGLAPFFAPEVLPPEKV